MSQDLSTSQSKTTEKDDPHDEWTEHIGNLPKEGSNSDKRPSQRVNWREPKPDV